MEPGAIQRLTRGAVRPRLWLGIGLATPGSLAGVSSLRPAGSGFAGAAAISGSGDVLVAAVTTAATAAGRCC